MNRKIRKITACATALALTAGAFMTNSIMTSADEGSVYTTEFNVDMNGEKKSISPYIYGVNDHNNLDKVTATAVRQGGNRYSAYNWETNYSNAGSDWKNSSDTHLSASSVPGTPAINLSKECNDHNIGYKFTTLQMLGYVSADKDGTVADSEVAPSSRWNVVKARKGGELSLTPDLTDNTVYMDEYVNYLVKTLGDSTTSTGIQGYSLDNEPALWFTTHAISHPERVTMSELVEKSIETASVVKDIDPNAEVFGPALWGYLACKQLADSDESNEWETIQAEGGYNWFIDYYLDEMKKASDKYGSRLIDCLDFHYYAQATDSTADILQNVRTLYEEGFRENSWIGDMIQWCPTDLPILPNVQNAVDKYYPGTKVAISEYDFYGGYDVSGAVVEAEALGCFADNNIYLATYWGDGDSPYTISGINLFTNYDGKNSSFGDTLLETSIEDSSLSNAYASIDSDDDSQVNVVITNKDMNNDEKATVNLKNTDNEYKSGVVYGIVEGSSDIVVLAKIDDIKDNSFTVNLPSVSVVHAVVSEDAHAFDDIKVFDPSDVPVSKEVVYESDKFKKTETGFSINVDNPEKIEKIVLDGDVKLSDDSSWYSLGGALCFTVDTADAKNQWAYKGFSVSTGKNSAQVEFDGKFTIPVGDSDSKDVEASMADNKIEIQTWWSSSEKDGDVTFDINKITVYYKPDEVSDTEPAVTTTAEPAATTTESVTTTEVTETTSSEPAVTTAEPDVTSEQQTSSGTESKPSDVTKADLLGDVNTDGVVDIVDVTALKQAILKLDTLDEKQAANANVITENEPAGTIDVKDLGQLIKYIIKVIDKF